jgi:hypothetical protein
MHEGEKGAKALNNTDKTTSNKQIITLISKTFYKFAALIKKRKKLWLNILIQKTMWCSKKFLADTHTF